MRYPCGNGREDLSGRRDFSSGSDAGAAGAGGRGAGELKVASGFGSESSYSVGRWPDKVAQRREPHGSKVAEETVGGAASRSPPAPSVRLRQVTYCADGRECQWCGIRHLKED